MSFHKVPVLIVFLILLLALVVPVSATIYDYSDSILNEDNWSLSHDDLSQMTASVVSGVNGEDAIQFEIHSDSAGFYTGDFNLSRNLAGNITAFSLYLKVDSVDIGCYSYLGVYGGGANPGDYEGSSVYPYELYDDQIIVNENWVYIYNDTLDLFYDPLQDYSPGIFPQFDVECGDNLTVKFSNFIVYTNGTLPEEPATPVASFTTNVTSGTVPLAVGFTDTSTNTPTGWNWSFGDGNWSNGTASVVSYLYEYPGTYNAFLIVSNGGGSSTSATTAITVTSGIVPKCEDQTGNITLSLFFNSTTSLGWHWDDPVNITKIAEDGLYVLSFDNSSDYFIGTGYSPETWHKLKIYNETDFGQLNCTTDAVPVTPTPIPIMPSTESNVNPANLFQYWPYAVLVLGLVVVFKKW